MFTLTLPLEIERKIFSSITDSSFSPAAQVMANSEIPILARRITSLEHPAARDEVAFVYGQQCQWLATLCRVSQRFKDELQPMLYTCIVVQSKEKVNLLVETLRTNLGLAHFVKSIVVMPWSWSAIHSRVIQSLVRCCPCLEAFQDYSLYPQRDRLAGCIDIPVGIQLKKVCARPFLVQQIFDSQIRLSTLTSLELIATEPSPLNPVISFPTLESLKIGINDCTLHRCILPSLRRLYIARGYYDCYVTKETAASTLLFLRSCGKRVTLLSFAMLYLGGERIALDDVFPSLRHLLVSTGRGSDWFLPAWSVPFFDIRLGHPRIENIGLHGTIDLLGSSCLVASDPDAWQGANYGELTPAIVTHFASLERGNFPHLKTILIMECQARLASLKPEQVALWDGIKKTWINDGIHVGEQDFSMD